MATALQQGLTVVLCPIAALGGGGILAAVRPPGPLLRSAVEHFTAVVLGFAAGVAAMFGVRRLTERLARSGSGAATLPLGHCQLKHTLNGAIGARAC